MSEYEYTEFRALDRTLSKAAQELLGEVSSRAMITARRFSVVYNFGGSLRADPMEMLAEHFDVYVFITNYGHRKFAVRLPSDRVDDAQLTRFLHEYALTVHHFPESVVLCWTWNGEDVEWSDGERWLDGLLGVRQEILNGDLRPLFLGWLCGYLYDRHIEEEEPDQATPPIAGLDALTPSQEALCELLNLSEQDLRAHVPDPALAEEEDLTEMGWDELAEAISTMSTTQQRDWLLRFAEDEGEDTRYPFLQWLKKRAVRQQPRLVTAADIDLDEPIYEEFVEQATMDANSEEEQLIGFAAMLEDEVPLPFDTWLLGSPVRVREINELDGSLVAVCVDEADREVTVPLSRLPLPTPPPAGASWIAAWVQWVSGR
ncbi:MAG: hypothetical protein AAFV53_28660 [Myxococcota bacterium]